MLSRSIKHNNLFIHHHKKVSTINRIIASSLRNHQTFSTCVAVSNASHGRTKEFYAMQKLGQLTSRAITNQKLNKMEEAIKVYKEILEMKPDSVFSLLQLGHIMAFNTNNRKEAIAYFEKVVEYTTLPETFDASINMDEVRMLQIEFQPKANYFLAQVLLEDHKSCPSKDEQQVNLMKAKQAITSALQLLTEVKDDFEISPETFTPFLQMESDIDSAMSKLDG